MALALMLNLGDRFYVDGVGFTLTSIASYTDASLTRDSDGKVFKVSDRRTEEIQPNVNVSVGARGQMSMARIVIEAPRSIKIERPSRAPKPVNGAKV